MHKKRFYNCFGKLYTISFFLLLSYHSVSALTVTVDSTKQVTCNGAGDGIAYITPTGTAPFTYTWDNNSTDEDATGLSGGVHTVTVTDASPATVTQTVSIFEPNVISGSIGSTSLTCNGANNGSATITISGGGTLPYSYSWSPTGGNTAVATGLPPDTYTVLVTDIYSCSFSATVTVTEPTAVSHSAISSTSVSCFGDATGTTTVTASGGVGGYTYSWSPTGGTNSSANGLLANTYTVTIKDANLCSYTATVVVSQPASATSHSAISSTSVSCFGDATGTTTVTASGGTPGYSYSWSPTGGTNSSATGLGANTYTVTIKDANLCVHTVTVVVSQPASALSHSAITSTSVNCFGNSTGAATVTASGGTPGYSYSWSPTGGTNSSAGGLGANTYTVTIRDANLCTHTATVVVSQPASAVSHSAISSTSVNCFGNSTGAATVTASGGTPGYSYSWSPTGGTNSSATGLSANTYTVAIRDANLCVHTATITVSQPPSLTVTATQTQSVTCNTGNNGVASVSASGGVSGYTYSWSSPGGTNTTLSNLTAGNYTITVTDANSCPKTGTATISQPTAITITTITATQAGCGTPDGTATVSGVSGGTSPYSYQWSAPGGTDATATSLPNGDYTVTITDANLCIKTGTVNVPNASGFSIAVSSFTMASCNGICDGAITTSLTGGTPSFSYIWSNSETTADITGLCDGLYSVTVTDGASCTATTSKLITEPAAVVLTVTGAGSICRGQSLQLTASATGGTGSYNYTWMPGGETTDTLTVSPTITKTYTLTGTDSLGCIAASKTATVIVNQPLAVAPISNSGNTICNGETAIISASATGGDGNYSYSWGPGGETTATISKQPTITSVYTITVTDNCGSTAAVRSFTLTVDSLPAVSFTIDNSSGCAPHVVNLTNTSSPIGVIWAWNLGDGNTSTTSNSTHTYTASGTYGLTLTVTDSKGCSNTSAASNTITVYPKPVASFTINPSTATGNTTTNFIFTNTTPSVTGYEWHLGDAANSTSTSASTSFTYSSAGTYIVSLIVTNANGCKDTVPHSVVVTAEETDFYLEVPNAFSPNGDGYQDFFKPAYMEACDLSTYKLFIYSTWGALIYYTEDVNKGWDGKASWAKPIGKTPDDIVQQDYYMWVISVNDLKGENHIKKGTVFVGKNIIKK